MAFSDTAEAMGAVTQLLIEQLNARTEIAFYAGRPAVSGERLNLFLYEVSFDPSMKNITLDENAPAPIWLVLKYIITAFDSDNDSDSEGAHKILGKGIRALRDMSYLSLTASLPAAVQAALKDNPEELKITFDEIPSDLISKLMQGQDEKYRFSMGFQVRPVMIAPSTPPAYNLLVGMDYNTAAPVSDDSEGRHLNVLPSMGPRITAVNPKAFEPGDKITLTGQDLNLEDTTVILGGETISLNPTSPVKNSEIVCNVDIETAPPNISAGSHTVAVIQTLSATRKRSSNLEVAHLLPVLDTVGFTPEAADTDNYFGILTITGTLLGSESDDIFLAVYQDEDGKVVKLFTEFEEFSLDPVLDTQAQLSVHIPVQDALEPGTYRVILRVNGEQARKSPSWVIAP